MRYRQHVLTSVALLVACLTCPQLAWSDSPWQQEFNVESCDLSTSGRNDYFILEPGYQIVLEGDDVRLEIMVLEDIEMVGGIATRVVEEREWEDGELHEVARNYFAICETTSDVFYFGEDVDYFKDGEVINHEGAWLAVEGNKPGLIMPGSPTVGMKYYQEIAPGVALDRAEIVSLDEVCETPVGTFAQCLKIQEGTEFDVSETEYKFYAPNVGIIQDDDLVLTKFGSVGTGQ